MKISMLFAFLILVVSTSNSSVAAAEVSPPPEVQGIAPTALRDLTHMSFKHCTHPFSSVFTDNLPSYAYNYSLSSQPSQRDQNGHEFITVGPVVALGLYYIPDKNPVTKTILDGQMSEFMQFIESNIKSGYRPGTNIIYKEIIQINGYPAAIFDVQYKDMEKMRETLIYTKKGKYFLSVRDWQLPSTSDRHAYAKEAMGIILGNIPDEAPTAETDKKTTAPTTGKPAAKEKAPTMMEKWKAEQQKELAEHRQNIDKAAKKLEYRYSEERLEKEKARIEAENQRAETERQHMDTRYDIEGGLVSMLAGEEAAESTDILAQHAKPGETYKVEADKIVYKNRAYTPVAYSANGTVTGYLWIDPERNIVKDIDTNRALFTYMYVFGLGKTAEMEKEAARYEAAAQKNDQEIQEYVNYKDAAKVLKLASNAFSAYTGITTGGILGAASVSLTAVDAGIFLTKMNALEKIGTAPDLSTYEDLTAVAGGLQNLNDLNKAVTAAREIQKLQVELQTLKNMEKIKATQTSMQAAKVTMVDAITSFGWAVFESKEQTGAIAEQAAVLAIKYSELKAMNLLIAKTIKDAEQGIDSDIEAKNIFMLPELKARADRLQGDVLATMYAAYKERKSSVSGYIGRFSLYLQGKSVDEAKVEQTILELQDFVDRELEDYYDTKIKVDVATGLAVQRAAL